MRCFKSDIPRTPFHPNSNITMARGPNTMSLISTMPLFRRKYSTRRRPCVRNEMSYRDRYTAKCPVECDAPVAPASGLSESIPSGTGCAAGTMRREPVRSCRFKRSRSSKRFCGCTLASVLDGLSAELTQWDDNVVYQMLEKVTVLSREMIRVTLRNGMEIEQAVEQPRRRKFV